MCTSIKCNNVSFYSQQSLEYTECEIVLYNDNITVEINQEISRFYIYFVFETYQVFFQLIFLENLILFL